MNKVYRNVWNENTQTWVAASELANSKTKSNTVCEQSIVKKIINKLGLKKIVSVTITALILEWQAIAPVYAANAAIVGGNNSGTVWPGGGYQYGGHGSMVFSGDDDHCGADRVNGRRTVSDGITAKDEYLRFIRNTAFGTSHPYGSVTSNKAEAWSDEGKTDGGTGYQAAPTGGDNNAMPVAYGIYSFAYGCGSYATGNYSTAFGANATATAGGAMAFGVASLASGTASIAFGISSQATGVSSVALGSMASSNGTGSVAVGLSSAANKDAAVALGTGATASGNSSVAVGNAAQAAGDQSISIGAGNQVSGRKSGAIGGVQSNAIFKNGEISATPSNPTNITGNNTYSLGNENGTIAVDDSGVFGNKNTISGTTEGVNNIRIVGNNNTVSSAKDLVFGNDNTVSSAKDLVFGNDNTVTATRGLILGNDNTVNADRGLIIGNNTSTGANATDAIAIGNSVSVSNASGIAIGTNATTIVDTGVALGSGSVANIDKGKTGFDPTGTNSAANNPTWTSTAGAVAIGNAGSGITRQLTGLAAGTNDTDAVNVAQMKNLASVTTTGLSSLSTAVSKVGDMSNVNSNISTLNSNVSALQSDALQWKNNADGSGAYDASHGTNQAQKITNVAAGLVEDGSTDAVNASQLYQVSTSSASGITSLSTAALSTTGKLNTVSNDVSALKSDALQWKSNVDGSGAYDASHGTNRAQKITNIAAGHIDEYSTEAVNAAQFYQLSTSSSTGLSTLSSTLNRAGDLTNVNSNISTLTTKVNDLVIDALQWHGNADGSGFYDASHGTNRAQRITNIAAGQVNEHSTDAVNAAQLYSLSTTTSTSLSNLNEAVATTGNIANISHNVNVLNDQVSTLLGGALQWKSNADGSGFYDASHATSSPQKISNVAAGVLDEHSTDAVNAAQLYSLSTITSTSLSNLNEAVATTGNISTVASNVYVLNTQVSSLLSNALQWHGNADGSGFYDASHGTSSPQKISNLAAGVLDEHSTDAVNAAQLYSLSTTTSTSLSNLNAAVANTGNVTNITNNVTQLMADALQWKKNTDGSGVYDASHGTTQAQKITNVAAGQLEDGSTDAVNAGQLYQLSTSSATNFSSLSTVVSRAGDLTNINGSISTANSNIADLQSDALQWKKNTDGTGAYDASHGTTQAQKITNVAAGLVEDGSTDAVNASQLYQVSTSSASGITSLSTAALNTTGKLNTVSSNVSDLQSDALQWKNNTNGSGAYDASHGTNQAQKITNVAAGQLEDGSTDAVNAGQLYQLSTSSATSFSSLSTVVSRAGDLTNINGNISTANSNIAALQSDALQWKKNVNGNGGFYDASHGTNLAQKITNVANGDLTYNSTDAVNGSQLSTTNSSLSIVSSSVHKVNDTVNRLEKDSLQWVQEENGNSYYDASHGVTNARYRITNVANGLLAPDSSDVVNGSQLYTTNSSINAVSTSVNSVTAAVTRLQDNTLQWNGSAYDAGHGSTMAQKITRVAEADLAPDSTDAVNGSQLNQTNSRVGSLSSTVASLNDSLNKTNTRINSIAESTSRISDNLSSATDKINDLDQNALQINGENYDANYKKITNITGGKIEQGSNEAVTGGQLFTTNEKLNTVSSSVGNLTGRLNGAIDRLDTVSGATATLSTSLAEVNTSISTLRRDALGWNDNAYDASHGSGAAQKITNVANGTVSNSSTDAVNGSQLYNLSTSLSNSLSTVTAGNNTGLSTTNSNVSTLSNSLSSAVNNISNLQRDALQWNGNAYDASHGSGAAQKITNVAAGQLADGSTDAVNAGQLYSISSSIISSVSSSVDQVVTESRTTIETMNKDIKAAQDDIKTAQDDIKTSKRLIDELQKNSVHFDDGTTAFSNQLTRDASNERTISNIADGRVDATSNQAVNGRQLYSLSTSTSTSLSSLQDQLHLASGTIPAGISTTLSSLQLNALQWNGSAYDASHGSGTAQKITNVASGDTGQNSTEAVNGGQLWQLKNEWKQDLQSLSSSVDTKLAQNSGGGNASAINEATEKANQAISDTQKLSASTADALSAVAASLGGNASYNPLTRAGTGGFTAPSYTTSNADGTAVTANNVGDAINNLYNGGSKYAKVNSIQAVASASGSDAIAVGGAAAASGKAAVAIGSQATASAENGVAIGNHASVTQNGGIALGANSVANTAAGINGYIPVSATAQQARAIQATTSTQAAVSVGDAANGVYRQITGVAAGTADTDAVNVAQLKGVNARMENINRYVNDVNDRVHRVERRAYSGTALAMALSGAYLPQLNAGEQTVGVGMGSYHGYAAVGINYKATNNTGKFSWGAGVSTTGRETGFNAGIGYKW